MVHRRWIIPLTGFTLLAAIFSVVMCATAFFDVGSLPDDQHIVLTNGWTLTQEKNVSAVSLPLALNDSATRASTLSLRLPAELRGDEALFFHALDSNPSAMIATEPRALTTYTDGHLTNGWWRMPLLAKDAGKVLHLRLQGNGLLPRSFVYSAFLGSPDLIWRTVLNRSASALLQTLLLALIALLFTIAAAVVCLRWNQATSAAYLSMILFVLLTAIQLLMRNEAVSMRHIGGIPMMWIAMHCFQLAPVSLVLFLRWRLKIPLGWTRALLAGTLTVALLPLVLTLVGAFRIDLLILGSTLSLFVVMLVWLCACVWRFAHSRESALLPMLISCLLTFGSTLAAIGYFFGNNTIQPPRFLCTIMFLVIACMSWDLALTGFRPFVAYRSFTALRIREEEYRIAVRQSGKLVSRYDLLHHRAYFQPETAAFFGLSAELGFMPDSLLTMGVIAPQSAARYREFYQSLKSGVEAGSSIFCAFSTEHMPVWLHADFTVIFGEQHRPEQAIVSCYEIKGMLEKEAAYERWRTSYRTLNAAAYSLYEADLTTERVTSQSGELLAQLPAEARGSLRGAADFLANFILCAEDRAAFLRLMDPARLLASYEQDMRQETLECRREHENSLLWIRVSVRMVADPHSADVCAFILIEDIEEQRRKRERENMLIKTDELTGLLSRGAFVERFGELSVSSLKDERHAVLMIDLDGFKSVNDTFGHRFGDKVLTDVAADLRKLMRSEDLLCRLGGDEYMICLKCVPVERAFLERRCQSILKALCKQFGEESAISASIGIALYPQDGGSFDELYQHADQALYIAKQRGRNRFVFFSGDESAMQATPQSPQQEALLPAPKSKPAEVHTLLIVDDQEINRAILKRIFQATCTVLEASNGREAMEQLRASGQVISAMLLDLLMPEMDGFAVLEAMNKDPYYQTIPVVVVSAAVEEENSLRAIELGAVDFVVKPINERLVLLRVRNAILRHETENLRAQNRDLLVQRSDEARHQQQLRYLAEHDSLTNICNKTSFLRNTNAMLRQHPDKPYCIVSFDVQRFRAVNDIFGHEEGDRLLRHIATQLQSMLERRGTCSRLDTDNFAFCIPYTQESLQECMRTLNASMRAYDLSFEVTLAFGVYLIDDRTITVSQMQDRADMAKRSVKSSYLEHWAFYDSAMREQFLEEQEIINHMSAALAQGEFVVYYQPKCRLDTGIIVGAEALVRWQHPQRGLLSPVAFIPLFEKNGFVMQLDVYVWSQTCALCAQLLKEQPNAVFRVSVNISRANLYNPTLCQTLDALCEKHGVPRSCMEVEITESAYMENAHLLLDLINELHKYGFLVAMDDFGSGYSSLNMLKEIPVDVLKLDMRFLFGLKNSDRGGSILQSMVRMANQLQLEVIAEGVETKEQARFLASIGCKLAQGYYYDMPMPEQDFLTRLQQQPAREDILTISVAGELEQLLCSA
ncbi:MAG: EAL domain-containing protein, partial [Clostridia bacterium]